jgi:Tfp pilus assembly protein PilV
MKRCGVTMTEVLVSIFVMAIGLISLLALFPIGALTMAQSIKDSRTAQAAANAFAVAEALGIRYDASLSSASGFTKPYDAFVAPVLPPTADSQSLNGGDVSTTNPINLYAATVLPAAAGTAVNNSGLTNSATTTGASPYDGPSYPVYVDPIGTLLGSSALPGLTGFQIPRLSVSTVTTLKSAYLWFALQDDITFNTDDPFPGSAYLLGGTTLEREGRYTWAYLMRRPKYGVNSAVDVTVVVYSGRSPQLPLGETGFAPTPGATWTGGINFDPTTNVVNLPYTGSKPSVGKGTWILDATMVNDNYEPDPHGFFYRVVGVTDGPGTSLNLELQTPPRMPTQYVAAGVNHTYGVLVIMDNVVEVFEKGVGWQP